jgi:hypothetical protein
MPNVNLSTLSGPELRRLLDSARQRGEAALSYRILQEMEARRENGERKGLFPIRRSTEPHTVDVDLGDPLDRDDDDDVPPMPYWRAPSQPGEAPPPPEIETPETPPPELRRVKSPPKPAPEPESEPPLSFRVPEPEPRAEASGEDWELRLNPAASKRAPPPPAPRGLRRGLIAGFAVGIAAGVALGWWVWGPSGQAPAPLAPDVPPVQTAALAAPLAPTPQPAAAPEPAPETAPTAPPEIEPTPPASEEAPAAVDSRPPEPQPEPPLRQEADACASEPTPADRTICGDPQLRELQRQLRRAYSEALDAHQDRALLRQRQLAWASARDGVTDPDRLIELYEQRIRRLDAATEAAREQR